MPKFIDLAQENISIKDLKKGRYFTFHIEDMAFGGKGIARIPTDNGNYTVFVANSIPGQTVRAKVVKRKKNYAQCKLAEVLERSSNEVETPYQSIPGAPFANWPLADQHAHKKDSTFELYKRIGEQTDLESKFDEFIPSPRDWHYRNKMEYSFSQVIWDTEKNENYNDFGLGFKHRGQWLSVENMNADSGLFDADVENQFKDLREYLNSTGLPAWHPARHKGFYRYINIRKSFSEDKLLFNLTTSSSHLEEFDKESFVSKLIELFGEDRLAGILHTIHDSLGDRAFDKDAETHLLYGAPIIHENLLDLDFEMSINSFFQPNPAAAQKLYQKAVDYALSGSDRGNEEVILDLFCGTGTIGQILAHQSNGAKSIIGVDIVESAIENARKNAELNELKNLTFFAADVGKFLIEYPQYKNTINTLVLDPPRSGIAPKTLKRVIQLEANRIVYISCNPATQARDFVHLNESGYILKKFSVVDQFPHTAHVETVSLFEKE